MRVREKETETEISYMPAIARAGQTKNQESGTPSGSPSWVAGAQAPGPSSSASWMCWHWAGVEAEAQGVQPARSDAGVPGSSLTCCAPVNTAI